MIQKKVFPIGDGINSIIKVEDGLPIDKIAIVRDVKENYEINVYIEYAENSTTIHSSDPFSLNQCVVVIIG